MEREIKFRAWDKENRQMVVSRQSIATIVGRHLRGGYSEGHLNGNGQVSDDNFDLMQFTGLKDKNGKEIYFDDILNVQMYDEESDVWNTGTALVVESLNKGVGMLFELDDEGNSYGIHAVSEGGMVEELWEDEELFRVEVIGNIHENPELL